jgi:hypothetical protein
MIEMPRRSVTRFFIPLIDVLTLLFCIFLLMPLFREADNHGADSSPRESAAGLFQDKAALERELQRRTQELERLRKEVKPQLDVDKLRAELERLRREKIETLQQRLFVRVLDIDPRTGALSYPDPGTPEKPGIRIASADTARALIRRHKQEAGERELYYVFLFPRADSGFPTEQQFEEYKRWFNQAASGVGNASGAKKDEG